MKRVKYIIIDDISPILFSEMETHAKVAAMAAGRPITSAGFCSLFFVEEGHIAANVYGESVSLKLKSDPEDAALIERMFSEY